MKNTVLKRINDRLFGYKNERVFCSVTDSVLRLNHDSGFFSNCSAILHHLAGLESHPVQIDATSSFKHYTNPGKVFDWNSYFLPCVENPPAVSSWKKSRLAYLLPHHSIYSLLDFKTSNAIVQCYFQPNPDVDELARVIIASYQLDLKNTVVVCLRGTDKASEVRPTPIWAYILTARILLFLSPKSRIWIQTDSVRIESKFRKAIGSRCFTIDLLPKTESDTVIHKLESLEDRAEFARNLLAITLLMSRARRVITYSGNVGYWIALFRGTGKGLIQFR